MKPPSCSKNRYMRFAFNSARTQLSALALARVDAAYAEALLGAGALADAEALIAKSRGKLAEARDRYPWDYAWALVRSARIAMARGDTAAAIAYSREAFKFAQPRCQDGSPVVLAAMDEYGTALAKNGRPKKRTRFSRRLWRFAVLSTRPARPL